MQHKQSGFTQIEIAIVMAIIGLLISLTIKGREMVESSRAKSLANDFRDIQVALFGYQGRFRALPGDDPTASAHLSPSAISIQNGNGNLRIEGGLNNYQSESFFLWQHVRLAGFGREWPMPGQTAMCRSIHQGEDWASPTSATRPSPA